MKMRRFVHERGGVVLAVLLFALVVAWTAILLSTARWAQDCRDIGGHPYVASNAPDLCLAPGAVLYQRDE